jgi:hypothetical protein
LEAKKQLINFLQTSPDIPEEWKKETLKIIENCQLKILTK